MKIEVAEYIRSLVPYVPGKPIEETQRELGIERVIKLASNENPLGPSPQALRALRSGFRDLHRYPDASAYRLKRALSKHLAVEPSRLILGNGSNEVIDSVVRTFAKKGDRIVTSEGAFIAYKICAQIHGVETVEVPVDEDLRLDPDRLLKTVRQDERAKIVFLANPNNPTGTYLKTDELRMLLQGIARVRGGSVLVVLDYAYWEYVTASDLPNPMILLKDYSNVVVLRTFSKIYGLAGLRIGYGVGAPEVILSLEKVRQPFNSNSPALTAAEAALSDRAFVRKAKDLNRQGMEYWEKGLNAIGVPYWPSQGNFLLANVIKRTGTLASEVYQSCLKRGVIFRPVANYGMPGALRISIGTMGENRIAFKALQEVCQEIDREA